MTPREIIKRNLEFTNPTRIGLNFGDNRRIDVVGAGIGPSLTWKQRTWVEGNLELYDDEWGNVWHRIVGMSQRGEIYQPALQQCPWQCRMGHARRRPVSAQLHNDPF